MSSFRLEPQIPVSRRAPSRCAGSPRLTRPDREPVGTWCPSHRPPLACAVHAIESVAEGRAELGIRIGDCLAYEVVTGRDARGDGVYEGVTVVGTLVTDSTPRFLSLMKDMAEAFGLPATDLSLAASTQIETCSSKRGPRTKRHRCGPIAVAEMFGRKSACW